MATGSKPVDGESAGGRLLRLDEVAERLTISRSMAWKIIAHGQLRSIRIGRALRVRPVDLERYLDEAARED
jgi:excisionase family DNA binding protein